MRLSCGLLCFVVLLGSASLAAAKPAYVLTTVNMRAAPGTTSEVVTKIPGGSLVDADNCTDGWCAVTWQEKSGFAIQTALDLSGHVPNRTVRRPAYGPPAGYVVDEPPVYYGAPPPVYYGYGPYWRHRYWRRW
ncbi:MAG TPA: SH3 domain-containing protein [Pseudolabrys sp.]|jgi:uncharacterized protein YraI|nr:SH3 domain-containing protein [Pseudolabrys sp.]